MRVLESSCSYVYLVDIATSMTCGRLEGHYEAVAKSYLGVFGDSLIVVGGQIYKEKFPQAIILPCEVKGRFALFSSKVKVIVNILKLFCQVRKSIIIFQSRALVGTLIGLLLIGSIFNRGNRLYFIQYEPFPYPRWHWAYWLFKMVKRQISGIICPNDKTARSFNLPACVCPDYIYASKDICTKEPPSKYDFASIGLQSKDKGSLELARFFAGRKETLLIAGKVSDGTLAEELLSISRQSPNVFVKLGYLNRDDYRKSLLSARYVFLNYSGAYSTHSSGIVYDALIHNRPVIGRRCLALKIIDDFKLGVLYDVMEELDIQSLLISDTIKEFKTHIKQYFKRHETSAFQLRQFVGVD